MTNGLRLNIYLQQLVLVCGLNSSWTFYIGITFTLFYYYIHYINGTWVSAVKMMVKYLS